LYCCGRLTIEAEVTKFNQFAVLAFTQYSLIWLLVTSRSALRFISGRSAVYQAEVMQNQQLHAFNFTKSERKKSRMSECALFSASFSLHTSGVNNPSREQTWSGKHSSPCPEQTA
jgi:hypothetical protein